MKKYFFEKKHQVILFLILFSAAILRFVNYGNRWGLAYDQARDVIVASYALENSLLPLIGPFSSAGQFVYGPQWYLILMGMISLFPGSILTPWVILTIVCIGVVYLMYLIGKEMLGKDFGLILAFLTAISTSQIGHSTNLISPSMAGIFSAISVYFFIRYMKYSKSLDAFILGFFVANTVNIHFQAIGLLVILPIGFLFSKRKFKQLLPLVLGFLIPFIPLFIFDLKTNFFESRNMLDYYMYGQNKIYVPNRWLTYVGVFWPNAWMEVIGGQILSGYLILPVLAIVAGYELIKRKIDRNILAIIISFFIIFVILRYYKGIIFGGYTVFLNPFILILTGWGLYKIYYFKKIIFVFFLVVLALTTLQRDIWEINVATNNTAKEANLLKAKLEKKYPNEKFAVYDYKFNYSAKSYPLVMFLKKENKIDDNGRKIGFYVSKGLSEARSSFPLVYTNARDLELYDLTSSSSSVLKKSGWVFVNPSEIYKSIEQWYFKNR